MSNVHSLDQLIIDNLTPQERTRSAAYLNEIPAPPGRFTAGAQHVEIGHPHLVAFIDRKPGANWMHPCRYLIINPADRTFLSIESNRPPVFGPLPIGWRLVCRSPDVQDWQLLKRAGPI